MSADFDPGLVATGRLSRTQHSHGSDSAVGKRNEELQDPRWHAAPERAILARRNAAWAPAQPWFHKMTKQEALQKLTVLVSRIPGLESQKRFSEDFQKWQHDGRIRSE